MRTLVAATVAAVALAGVVPAVSHAGVADAPARVTPQLATTLGTAPPRERLTVLVQGTAPSSVLDGVRRAGLSLRGELTSIGVAVATGTPAAVRSLTTMPGITYVEQNRALHFDLETSRKAIRATEAMATPGLQFDGSGETIAVVDGGTDGTHPMFTRRDGSSKVVRNLRVACLDEVCPAGAAADPFILEVTDKGNDSDTEGAGGHGTHVTGIAAGLPVKTSDGHSFSGVAPGASVVAISTGAAVDIYGAATGLDWIARHHADPCGKHACPPITVVNNSWGDDGGPWDPQSALAKVEATLVRAGVTLVFANGNGDTLNDGGDGSDNRSNPEAQAPFPGVISVANYDDADTGTRDGTLDSSSSRGDRTKPQTWPDLAAPGTGITSACRPYLPICEGALSPDPDYGTISGTSMAAPHVAGAVAILQQAARASLKRRLSPAEVENILEDSAYKLTTGAPYATDPSNRDNTSSFDKGHGLLDIVNALHLLQGTAPTGVPARVCRGLSGVDPKGEPQPYGVTLVNGPYDPAVDLTAVALRSSATAGTVTLVLRVANLSDTAPTGGGGVYAEATFDAGGAHTLIAQRDSFGTYFEVDGKEVKGTFDAKADTITVIAPKASFTPALAGHHDVSGVTVKIGRIDGALVMWADDATTGCGPLDL